MRIRFSVPYYSRAILDAPCDDFRYKLVIHELPRRFHEADRDEQCKVLRESPPLTGTRWDALLAATVEHIARLHDHEPPPWTEEPERFLETPWIVSRNKCIAAQSLIFCPAAFIRDGALPDPLDLDERGGERNGWIPEP